MNLASLQRQRQAFENSPIIRGGSPSPIVKKGYSYEDKVGLVLETVATETGLVLLNHPWIEDDGWHQPDYLLISPSNSVIVLEVKLTYTLEGVVQLARYQRVLSKDYDSVTRVLVCKNLARGCPAPIESLYDAYDDATWHLYL